MSSSNPPSGSSSSAPKSEASSASNPPSSALPSIQDLVCNASVTLSSVSDAIAFAVHCAMLEDGFRCVGLGESSPSQDLEEGKIVPDNWNSNGPDVYVFKYKHSASSLTFSVKMVSVGEQLMIHAFALEDKKKTFSLGLAFSEYIRSASSSDISSISSETRDSRLFKDLQTLSTLVRIHITRKLVPFINKEGYEDDVQNRQAAASQTEERRGPRGGAPPPAVPHPEPGYMPSRETVPPAFMPRTPFGVGAEDLYPSGPGGIIGGIPAWGPNAGGSGSMVGPRHPGFGPVNDPFAIGGRGDGIRPPPGPFDIPPGSVPPGARFDPFGPPGMPGFPGPRRGFPPGGGPGRGGFGGFGGGMGGGSGRRIHPDLAPPPDGDEEPDVNPYWM